jgi:hypothetical protein
MEHRAGQKRRLLAAAPEPPFDPTEYRGIYNLPVLYLGSWMI